jgi:hypothetical protein
MVFCNVWLPIPLIPVTHSDASRQPFRMKAATCSDSIRPPLCRSEATLVFDILPIH